MLISKTILPKILLTTALTVGLLSCECCKRPPKEESVKEPELQISQIVNFYVENSGSMKGFFSGNSRIKDIIKDYYDRIDDSKADGDTITLSFVNTDIENFPGDIKEFLLNCQSKCNASYTKIDEILRMAMDGINDSTINIVISDYSFESDNSSLPMAMSGITGLFAKELTRIAVRG